MDRDADPEAIARSICLQLLAAAPRTRAELALALSRRRVPGPAADAVLSRLAEVGLVDDQAFASAWVRSRHVGRGLARRALGAELRRKGVDAAIVDAALREVDAGDEEAAARGLVVRRLPTTTGLSREVRTRRLAGMLARRGYPPAMAVRVVRSVLADSAEAGQADGGPDSHAAPTGARAALALEDSPPSGRGADSPMIGDLDRRGRRT